MSRASEAVLLKDHLKELRLPAMRRDYAECARPGAGNAGQL